MAKKASLPQTVTLTAVPEIRFGDRLRVLRRTLKLGQDQMGELLGVDGGRYGNWEANTAKPNDLIGTAQMLEDKLGYPGLAGWLLLGARSRCSAFFRLRDGTKQTLDEPLAA